MRLPSIFRRADPLEPQPGAREQDILSFPDDIEASYRGVYPLETDFFAQVLQREAGPAARVLEIGCGFGRVSHLLAQRGFAVTGLDRHPAMLDGYRRRASDLGLPERLLEADFRSFSVPEPFDALLSPLGLLNVAWSKASLAAHLRCAALALRPGGCYLAVVVAAQDPRRISPHLATWETEEPGLRTRTAYRFDPHPSGAADLAVFDHLLVVSDERSGAPRQRVLRWGGGMRIWTVTFLADVCAEVGGFQILGWHRLFDAGVLAAAPRDEDVCSAVLLRRT